MPQHTTNVTYGVMGYLTRSPIFTAALLAAASISTPALAQTKTFTVGKGSPAQQLAQVESVSDLETFTGRTDKVTGWIKFDPAKRTGSGLMTVDLASIDTGIPLRNDHMRDKGWLDTAKHPEAKFETTTVKRLKGDQYQITGKFTLKGVTKKVTAAATVKYLKESETTRGARFKGDVLQVRADFSVKLSDFGVEIPTPAKGKVAPTVRIRVDLYAQSGA